MWQSRCIWCWEPAHHRHHLRSAEVYVRQPDAQRPGSHCQRQPAVYPPDRSWEGGKAVGVRGQAGHQCYEWLDTYRASFIRSYNEANNRKTMIERSVNGKDIIPAVFWRIRFTAAVKNCAINLEASLNLGKMAPLKAFLLLWVPLFCTFCNGLWVVLSFCHFVFIYRENVFFSGK